MDINKIKSNLEMKSLLFKECSVKRTKNTINGELKADLQKNIIEAGAHTYDVELKLTIEGEGFSLLVVTAAQFVYEAEKYDKEESIVNNNTVAIMFPFVRSQVSLLTTQPGMSPIVLPPINTAKFK